MLSPANFPFSPASPPAAYRLDGISPKSCPSQLLFESYLDDDDEVVTVRVVVAWPPPGRGRVTVLVLVLLKGCVVFSGDGRPLSSRADVLLVGVVVEEMGWSG